MEEPIIIKTTIEFVCPHCEMAVVGDLVPEEDLWVEMAQDRIIVHAYIQCPECGEDWEIVLREIKIL